MDTHKDFYDKKQIIKLLKDKLKTDNYELREKEQLKEAINYFETQIKVYGYWSFTEAQKILENTYNYEGYVLVVQTCFISEEFKGLAFHLRGDVRAGYSDYFILDSNDCDEFINLLLLSEDDDEVTQ